MTRRWTRARGESTDLRDERGAVLAEFALIVPALLVILFGIVEVGIALSRAQAVEAAAREGARLASLSSSTTTEIEDRVDSALGTAKFDGEPTVSIVPPTGCVNRQGESVSVVVTAPHWIEIPFVVDQQMTLTGEAVFRCEA